MALAALATAAAMLLSACGQPTPAAPTGSVQPEPPTGQDITLWLAGGDTPTELREYLQTEYNKQTGAL
jgi:N,N'-diacetylchitobiose transport system substrate-binding protein